MEIPAPEGDEQDVTPERPVVTTRSGRVVRPPSKCDAYISIANYDGTYELPFQESHPLTNCHID